MRSSSDRPMGEEGLPESEGRGAVWFRRRGLAPLLVAAAAAAAIAVASAATGGAPVTTPAPSPAAVASAAAERTAEPETDNPGSSKDTADKAGKPASKTKSGTATKEDPGSKPAAKESAGSLAVAKDAVRAATPKPVAQAVQLREAAKVAGGIATVSKIEAIHAKAEGIGQIAGPAIRFVVEVQNTSAKELRLDTAEITVEAGPQKLPAIQLDGEGAELFPQEVAAGKSASGTFVFQIPEELRDQVRIYLNYSASESLVAFEGAAPRKAG